MSHKDMKIAETVLPLFCNFCLAEREMELVRETKLKEVYRCPVCGMDHEYTVR